MRSTLLLRLSAVFAFTALVGCSGSDDAPAATVDAFVADTATEIDSSLAVEAGAETAALDSAGDSASDSSVGDSIAPFDILGTASGECGAIKGLIKATGSVVVEIPLTFDSTDKYERARLSPGGKVVYDAPNAGGSSKESEVMTYELLYHCEDAVLLKTETLIKYGPAPDGSPSTITDLLITIGGENIGVNPKRVFKPLPLSMTDDEVRTQLIKDFQSINGSSARVLAPDKWVKQILHIWVPSATYYDAVKRVLPTIDETTKSNTIVLITRTTGGGFLYCDPDPAPGTECPPIK